MWCIGLLALNGVFHALLFAAALLPDQTVLLSYGLEADAFATGVEMLLMLITGIVFIVWFHRAFKTAMEMAPQSGLTMSKASAVWCWFVPIGNYWLPYQRASAMWRWTGGGSSWPIVVWWILWVVGRFTGGVVGRLPADMMSPEMFRSGWMLATGVSMLSAFAAAYYVRAMDGRLRRACEGVIGF